MRFRRYEIFHDVLAPAINHVIAAREERRRVRRLRRLAALAVGLLIVALAIVGVFAYLWHRDYAKLTAESRQLAADAELNAARDPELSARWLCRRCTCTHEPSGGRAAGRAPGLQAVRTFREGTTVFSAAFDPVDANKVASADGYGDRLDLGRQDRAPRAHVAGRPHEERGSPPDSVAFNPAGTQLIIGLTETAPLAVFDTRTGRRLETVKARPSSCLQHAVCRLAQRTRARDRDGPSFHSFFVEWHLSSSKETKSPPDPGQYARLLRLQSTPVTRGNSP